LLGDLAGDSPGTLAMSALKLLTSMASRELLRELATRFEGATSQGVSVEAAGGVEVAKRVRGAEAADIVVLARNTIEGLAQEGSNLVYSLGRIHEHSVQERREWSDRFPCKTICVLLQSR